MPMRKIAYVLFIAIWLISCRESRFADNGTMKIISVENAAKDSYAFLDSIEVIPLETNDSVLIGGLDGLKYIEAEGVYVVIDRRNQLFLFDSQGRHLANSMNCQGPGPEEYVMFSDVAYNPYEHTLELYDPLAGLIHVYDMQFRWVRNLKLEKAWETAGLMNIIGPDLYAFDPVLVKENDLHGYWVDYSDESRPVKTQVPYAEDNYLAHASMVQEVFSLVDSVCYYVPRYLDSHIYTIDLQDQKLTPIYKLDFGDGNLPSRDKLDSRFGKAEMSSLGTGNMTECLHVMEQKMDYLVSSPTYYVPMIRLISLSYVYVQAIRERETYHLLHNRNSGETFFLTPQADWKMYRCFLLNDNVLQTVIYPYEIDQYINESNRKYLSEASLRRLMNVKEDDNDIVVRYYLTIVR